MRMTSGMKRKVAVLAVAMVSMMGMNAQTPTHDTTSKVIYGNGTPITITGNGTSGATVTYGGTQLYSGSLAGYTIYGGSATETVDNTSITITGDLSGDASPATIYGGGKDGSVTGTATITVQNGATLGWATIADNVGFATDFSEGFRIFGGGKNSSVGSTSVTIGGTVHGFVFGGGETGDVSTTTNITVSGAVSTYKRVNYNTSRGGTVYGGGLTGTVTGKASVNVTGTVVNNIYGGGNDESAAVGSTAVTFGGTGDRIYGGGYKGSVTGNTQVNISGGSAAFVYGGGNEAEADVTGNVTITVTGGGLGSVSGTRAGDVGGNVAINWQGGTITVTNGINGGSDSVNGGTVAGSATINISGGSVPYVRGDYSGTVTGPAAVNITGGKVTADATADALTISGGDVTVQHGNFTTGNSGTVKICIHSQSVTSLHNAWKGIIGLRDQTQPAYTHWTVVGEQTLTNNLTLNGGDTLTIPADSTLNLASGVTITHGGTKIDIQGTLTGAGGNNEIIINKNVTTKREVLRGDSAVVENVALKFPVTYNLNGVTAAGEGNSDAPTEIDVFAGGETTLTVTPLSGNTLNELYVNKATTGGAWNDVFSREGSTLTIDNSKITEPIEVFASATLSLNVSVTKTDDTAIGDGDIALNVYRGQSDATDSSKYTIKVTNSSEYDITVSKWIFGVDKESAKYFSFDDTGFTSGSYTINKGENATLTICPKFGDNYTYSDWEDGKVLTEDLVLKIGYTPEGAQYASFAYLSFATGTVTVVPAITIGGATIGDEGGTEITIAEGYSVAPTVSATLTAVNDSNAVRYGNYRLYETDADNTKPTAANPLPAEGEMAGWINPATDSAYKQRKQITAGGSEPVSLSIPTGLEVGTHYFGMAVMRSNNNSGDLKVGDQWQYSTNAVKVTVTGSLAAATVELDRTTATYTGSVYTPTITVTKDGTTLTAGTDYDVVWRDADGNSVVQLKNAGSYTPTVVGKGIYVGEATSTASFTIAKAPAPTLPAVTASRNYALGKVSVPTGIVAGEGSAVTEGATTGSGAGKVSEAALDGKGNLTFTLSGGANGDEIVLPVSIQSPNYDGDITTTVTVTLTDRLDQRPLTVNAASPTVAVGGTLELSATGGSGRGAVTYEVVSGTGSASVSGGTLTGGSPGTVTVIATKAGTGQYNPARSQPLVITVE